MNANGTHAQIVATASDLIWRRGYNRTSVDDIIRAAGICKGSFYHHFSSKESLGLAVIDAWVEHFGGHISANLSPDRTPEQNLHAILDAMVTAQQDSGYLGCPLGRLALEMGDVSEAFQLRLLAGFDTIRELFATYLREAGMPAEQAAEHGRYMLATLEGSLMLDKVRGGGEVLNGLIAAMKTDVSRKLVDLAAGRVA